MLKNLREFDEYKTYTLSTSKQPISLVGFSVHTVVSNETGVMPPGITDKEMQTLSNQALKGLLKDMRAALEVKLIPLIQNADQTKQELMVFVRVDSLNPVAKECGGMAASAALLDTQSKQVVWWTDTVDYCGKSDLVKGVDTVAQNVKRALNLAK